MYDTPPERFCKTGSGKKRWNVRGSMQLRNCLGSEISPASRPVPCIARCLPRRSLAEPGRNRRNCPNRLKKFALKLRVPGIGGKKFKSYLKFPENECILPVLCDLQS